MNATKQQYKLIPPDGGWGIVITIFVAVSFLVTLDQLVAFGIIYGYYLRQIADEASASATINGLFNTVLNLMGLFTNHLMQNHSFRYVGLLGSIIYFIGNICSIFASSVLQLCITFGIMQAVGFGLMLPAMFASINEYFDEKKNFMMGVTQSLVAGFVLVVPYFAQVLLDEYGYRGTIAILAALSLHSFAGMLTLHPVKWHMIKVPIPTTETTLVAVEQEKIFVKYSQDSEKYKLQIMTEIKKQSRIKIILDSISKFLMISLIKDLIYVNISVGASFAFMSDMMFISLLPMFLLHMGYNSEETAYLMTIFMTSDLVGRILFSLFNAFVKIRNRKLFLIGCIIITVFRIFFVICAGEKVITVILIISLGLLRCFIQVPIPLILSEYAGKNFPAAYSLYRAVTGVVSIISGQMTSLVALHTGSDIWIQILLIFQILLCIIPWFIEIYNKKNK